MSEQTIDAGRPEWASRLLKIRETAVIVGENPAGFTRTDNHDERTFYILPAVWRSEVCRGRDAKAIAAALIERGILEPGPDGKFSRSLTVPALGQSTRLYCINSRVFEGDNDG